MEPDRRGAPRTEVQDSRPPAIADERPAERRLRELRARVKVARAVVATTPGLVETLQRHWQRAARFYASFGITEALCQHGVPAQESTEAEDIVDRAGTARDGRAEQAAGAGATVQSENTNQACAGG